MELAVLDSSFRRSQLVENWNSLIWTERHSKNGDFQLTSYNIADCLTVLPIQDPMDPPLLVAIDSSEVPMVVETHKLDKDKNGAPKIVVSGRSFDTVLDRRLAIKIVSDDPGYSPYRTEWSIEANTAAHAAYQAAYSIITDGMNYPEDIIPEILLVNSVSATADPDQPFIVDVKELYAWMVETLALGKYGIRAELAPDLTNKIRIIIYAGVDRRVGEDAIVFDVALDQIDDASYLFSQVGHKNSMILGTDVNEGADPWLTLGYAPTTPWPTGLQLRTGFQDLSSEIELDTDSSETQALLTNKGDILLSNLQTIALFAGGVAESVSEGYGNSYFLGDIVRLQGEYTLTQDARVAEFVRTQDPSGTKSYPTFEAVTE